MEKLIQIVSYILSVYPPSFIQIHLKQATSEGSYLTLFQRDFLFACREVNPELTEEALKYYYEHASQWLNPKNVPLNEFGEVSPLSVEAASLPASVNILNCLKERSYRLRYFFTIESKEAPCIFVFHNQPNILEVHSKQ